MKTLMSDYTALRKRMLDAYDHYCASTSARPRYVYVPIGEFDEATYIAKNVPIFKNIEVVGRPQHDDSIVFGAYDLRAAAAVREAVDKPGPPPKALDRQEGGAHYKDLPIQPVEYITKNNIPYLEGNVIKYVTRHATKHGREDLLKARHYIDLILEMRYEQ